MRSLLTPFFALLALNAFSQCLIQKIPFNQRVEQASLIVEGEVISQQCFEDELTSRIFTINTIEVYNTLKGAKNSQVELITFGGKIGDRLEMASPSLKVQVGDVGVFLLAYHSIYNSGKNAGYFGVSGPSSFVVYNKINQKAIDAFETFNSSSLVKKEIAQILGVDLTKQKKVNWFYNISANKKASITSFTDTVSAGSGFVLTINGSGFGNVQGTIGFADADKGGVANIEISDDYYFKSWTDKKIEVVVPQQAGTGKFYVVTANNDTYTSANDLVVIYSRLQVVYSGATSPNPKLYYPVLDNDNGDGGITWRFNKDFFNDDNAVESILRALQSWRCSTGVNFNVDTLNAVNNNVVARDGVHTIMWQNSNQSIPTGALAVTFSMWSGCFNSTTKDLHWYLDDVDMVFDDVLSNNRTWNKELRDPTADEYDLESVALHELGHAHQLGHIIDATGVMHYSIKNGEKKRLLNDKVDVVAGLDVMQYSTDTTGCSDVFAMVAIKNNCKLTNIVDVDAVFTISDNVLCVDDILWIKNLSTPIGSNFYWRIPKGFSFEADHGDSVGYRANTAGIYNFGLVVENSGFWDSTSYPIQINKTPEPNFKIDDITCNGAANGKATFILSEEKGTPPFDIVWADTEKSQNPRNKMTKGTYTYTCIDATGCSRLGSVRIAEPDSLLITKIASEPSWGGLNRGKAYVIATGGTPPYKYNWNDANLQKTDTANNLAAGDYTVEIVDDNDCVINGEVSVTEVSSGLTHPNINALIKPNPASETLFIENEYEFNTVVVYTINGKKVIETQLFRGVNQVDINILQTGIYYVLLQGEKHEIKGKLLVR